MIAAQRLTVPGIRVSPLAVIKNLRGAATQLVPAAPDQCLALLEAVEAYPDWYPEVVREVDVLEREPSGQARRARTKLHLSRGPVVKDFDLVLAVIVQRPRTVRLTKVSDHPSQQQFDVAWNVQPDAGATRIDLELQASLGVPRFLPLGGIADAIAGGFVSAAARALASG